MFSLKKILLPVDFSERCIGAGRFAEALAERFGSEVTLLHVMPPPHYEFSGMEISGSALTELYATRGDQLQQQCDTYLVREIPQLKPQRVLLEGDPARTIVDYAHDHQMGLIVLPTHGYGPFRRFVLGSVTTKILHDADCPVWTGVHLEEAPPVSAIRFQCVAAAVDLGPQTEKVLSWASQFAAEYKARLVILHATPDIAAHVGEYFDPNWRLQLDNRAKEEIARLQEKLGTKAEVIVQSGDAPLTICSAVQRLPADLLVIGRNSATGILGRLRTTAYSIIRQSPSPVVSV